MANGGSRSKFLGAPPLAPTLTTPHPRTWITSPIDGDLSRWPPLSKPQMRRFAQIQSPTTSAQHVRSFNTSPSDIHRRGFVLDLEQDRPRRHAGLLILSTWLHRATIPDLRRARLARQKQQKPALEPLANAASQQISGVRYPTSASPSRRCWTRRRAPSCKSRGVNSAGPQWPIGRELIKSPIIASPGR